MKKAGNKKKRKRKRSAGIYFICWLVVPANVVLAIILDGLGLYCFNTERLIAIGACIIVTLIPLFSEITVKDVSVKKENDPEM